MAEETTLDTAIPPIGWQEGERGSPDSELRRQLTKKKTKKKNQAAGGKPARPQPAEGTGTHLDVTV